MARQETYGNWLCPPPKRLVRQPGIYSGGSQMTPVGSFRPDLLLLEHADVQGLPDDAQSSRDSPDSFDDDDDDDDGGDYDDVSLSEPGRDRGKPPAAEDLQSQRSKGGAGVYTLAGKPASSSPTRAGVAEAAAGKPRRCRDKSVVTLYLLVALSFLMWVALFLLAVAKYSELSGELKVLSSNYSQSVLQELAETQRGQAHVRSSMSTYYKELQDLTALICQALPHAQPCSPGWKVFEKSCYSFSSEPASWDEAKQICADLGAHLVIVDSDQEQKFLKDNVNSSSWYWLGLSDRRRQGTWLWVDGQRLSISYWSPWQEQRDAARRDCGTFGPTGVWSDESCAAARRWVCEKPRHC